MRRSKMTFSDLLKPSKLRWPIKGDRLFAAAPALATEADIHPHAFTRSVFLMSGYKDAADILVDEAIEDDVARAGLIYPILFCYRQFIELSLKWQIATYGSLADIPKPGHGHVLEKLLEDFRRLCHTCGASDDDALDAVSECIAEFAQMDPNSFTFRYAADKRGNPYPVIADRIDLSRLKDVMEGIDGFFSGCDGYFDSLQGAQPDY